MVVRCWRDDIVAQQGTVWLLLVGCLTSQQQVSSMDKDSTGQRKLDDFGRGLLPAVEGHSRR